MAYHWLKTRGRTELYADYLNGDISRPEFYEHVPEQVVGSVINAEIGAETLPDIFWQVDELVGNRSLDLIVGGPPCQC